MGNFYVNITTHKVSAEEMIEYLKSGEMSAFVIKGPDDYCTLYEEGCDDQNMEYISSLLKEISSHFSCPAFGVLNHDDDILAFELWANGEKVDEYDSCPDYFLGGGDRWDPEGGDAEILSNLLGNGTNVKEIEKALRTSDDADENFSFAIRRHGALAKALGLPSHSIGFGYRCLSEGEIPEGIQPEDILKTTGVEKPEPRVAMESSRPRVRTLSLAELPEVIERAKAEEWRELALIGPSIYPEYEELQLSDWPAEHIFRLSKKLEDATQLSELTTLTTLDLTGNRIGDERARGIASLQSLTFLNLSGNAIVVEGARAIALLPSLISLDLADCDIGPEEARAIAPLPSLTSLDLSWNKIGDEGARGLASLQSLTSLDLTDNGVGAEGARALASLSSLTSLNLWNNRIGPEGAQAIASLKSLNSLDLGNNLIGSEGATAIASFQSLTSVNLECNLIGSEGARAIASLKSLTSLDLGNNLIGEEGLGRLLRSSPLPRSTLSPTASGLRGRAPSLLSNPLPCSIFRATRSASRERGQLLLSTPSPGSTFRATSSAMKGLA